MDKIDSLNQVAEFHTTFKAPILETPQIPSPERCSLRVELLQEELNELKQAIEDQDIVEIADALCDLQYVLSGAVLEFGLGSKFAELFSEVQRSNMSKACDNEEQAQETVEFYKAKEVDSFYEKSGEKYNVYRKTDHKVLKNKYYSPADLKTIIEK
ncbi:nucleoside triphosphate pyrophosphohydrolase family protein [Chryseobacterium sp. Leaf201]|uniref:nucleoside triphosphate pyrophosphohydrolase family protein n=1 Tax=Chryseobacterium sp. Leaf201 TaxID=1735672 RepID=UPI0006F3E373|nr:nucleoside triphosphate pyrophosphohydrolase family protein [Chryseobacterium sp. Leaf201]KQM49971.1 hypothetical protein ASE55_01965 [Chryseobacterium sp. Leaf201]